MKKQDRRRLVGVLGSAPTVLTVETMGLANVSATVRGVQAWSMDVLLGKSPTQVAEEFRPLIVRPAPVAAKAAPSGSAPKTPKTPKTPKAPKAKAPKAKAPKAPKRLDPAVKAARQAQRDAERDARRARKASDEQVMRELTFEQKVRRAVGDKTVSFDAGEIEAGWRVLRDSKNRYITRVWVEAAPRQAFSARIVKDNSLEQRVRDVMDVTTRAKEIAAERKAIAATKVPPTVNPSEPSQWVAHRDLMDALTRGAFVPRRHVGVKGGAGFVPGQTRPKGNDAHGAAQAHYAKEARR